jgi:hypothetical protein
MGYHPVPDIETRLRRFIEDHLPWFDAQAERQRDRRTERIRLRSIAARVRSEKVIAEYRAAERKADAAAESVIKEARRGR